MTATGNELVTLNQLKLYGGGHLGYKTVSDDSGMVSVPDWKESNFEDGKAFVLDMTDSGALAIERDRFGGIAITTSLDGGIPSSAKIDNSGVTVTSTLPYGSNQSSLSNDSLFLSTPSARCQYESDRIFFSFGAKFNNHFSIGNDGSFELDLTDDGKYILNKCEMPATDADFNSFLGITE